MELMISLAHFCDNHGPTSIICTQALPISCFSCAPSSASSSCASLEEEKSSAERALPEYPRNDESFDFGDVRDNAGGSGPMPKPGPKLAKSVEHSKGTNIATSQESFSFDDVHESATSDKPPPKPLSRQQSRQTRSSSGTGSCCTNCNLSLPPSSLTPPSRAPFPASTPPSSLPSGCVSSPRLRTKTPVRVYTDSGYSSADDSSFPPTTTGSSTSPQHVRRTAQPRFLTPTCPSSFSSTGSSSQSFGESNSARWHEHTQTYLSTHLPPSSHLYTSLRRSIVRTLSGEQLPQHLSSGRLFFGNASDGYTIAYTFRLTDRWARGGGRLYAFVVLAAGDLSRVYGIVNTVWRKFEEMAEWLCGKVGVEARRGQERESDGDELAPLIGEQARQPMIQTAGSFLTSRYGHSGPFGPGAQGPSLKGRGLVEMTGDARVFARVHMQFVELLKEIG